MQLRYDRLLQTLKRPGVANADVANAFGELGMVLHAAEYYDAAEPCYVNAERLAPAEMRWPYYLAHLYKARGKTEQAEVAFTRALELAPDEVATLIWLGRVNLDKGRPAAAEPLFAKALARMPRSVPALAGLGSAALAKQDYEGAAARLEAALAIDPDAESLHAPLAMAYRGLGQIDKAQPHLRQWRSREIPVPDPLRQQLDLLLESGLSYELRGIQALDAKNWATAAAFFRQGVQITPTNTPLGRSLQHKLGTALFMQGDVNGASKQFEAVVQAAPASGLDESSAKAHYSLAVLMASRGQAKEAIEHFSAAVRYQPTYAQAQLGLADALRRSGRAEASLPAYREALVINPRDSQARVGYAIALAGAERYKEARDWLVESTKAAPDRPELAHALARLLATAPDDRVRDGRRAKGLVDTLLEAQRSTDLGETLAMTLAELGDFAQAISVQRGVITAAERAGHHDAVRRMNDNLARYEHHQPCRTPWRYDEVEPLVAVPAR
jgi:tetratricopeptide (TPR) repeat protein